MSWESWYYKCQFFKRSLWIWDLGITLEKKYIFGGTKYMVPLECIDIQKALGKKK